MPETGTGIRVVLFDLGGVLVDFGGVEPMRHYSGIDSEEELWARWLACPWVRTFERGGCSAESFAAGVVADWGLRLSPGEFRSGFRNWVGGPLPGAEALVREVRARRTVGCLSNTNRIHWEDRGSLWLVDVFDHRFLSFEMGLVKPDPEVFCHVCEALNVAPEDVLFLDDNAPNVEAAHAAGMQARQTRGVDQARAALVEAAVL
jgi:glucose-1-phosphatase